MTSIRDTKICSPGDMHMTIKVGINGFGRIGRCTLSHIAASGRDDIEVIKVNATGPLDTPPRVHEPSSGSLRPDIEAAQRAPAAATHPAGSLSARPPWRGGTHQGW